ELPMVLPDFLTMHQFGDIRITGHRIGLFHIAEQYRDGMTAEQIYEQYDTLELDLIKKVIDFYLANRAEVDRYVDECRAEITRQESEPRKGPSLEELLRRKAARENAKA